MNMKTAARIMHLSAAAAILPILASPVAAQPVRHASERQTTPLSTGWMFRFGEAGPAVTAADFDDAKWDKVQLPHTWNRLGEYAATRSGATDVREGVAWYRLRYTAPTSPAGQHQYLDFAAVGSIADVWVNGVHVGAHKGAFSRFRFDVTKVWRPGAQNLIAVRADNSKREAGSSTSEVLPLSSDFFIYGGLYRGVSLITTGPVGIDLLDYGGPGVYATATKIEPGAAEVSVLTRLRNSGATARHLTATASIIGADGRIVARTASASLLDRDSVGEVRQSLRIAKPHLWKSTQDPYLYRVSVEISDAGRLVDQVSQPLGIRTVRFDPNNGFFLNGKFLKLHGVSRHQDRQGEGWALTHQDHVDDMALIKEMGANTVRGAHYEHADDWYAEADKAGMIMWAEVPFVSTASFDGSDGTPGTFANADQQTIELIRQQFNHPAIVMWSTGNEIDLVGLRGGATPKSLKLLQAITARARAEDPSRATTFADCCEDSAYSRKDMQVLAGTTDLIGYNRYYGWYYGKPEDMGPVLDRFHKKHPSIPMSVSEYGAGGALTQHADKVEGGPVNSFGGGQPEEYESFYHEQNWKQIAARPYIFASWVWNMFDFGVDSRREGDSTDLNTKGLVAFDHKTKKDAFYFYKAAWSATPTLHLTGQRYVNRAYPVVDVKAYSNVGPVTLAVNGIDRGKSDCPDHICLWHDVRLQSGRNTVLVTAQSGRTRLSDAASWIAPDARAGLHIDVGDLLGRTSAAGLVYGSDDFFDGGEIKRVNMAIRGAPTPAAKVVTGEDDLKLYDGYREGAFRYALPLPDGRWTITLHMFEPSAALADTRSFTVKIDGHPVLVDFNPAKAAGGTLKSFQKSFSVSVTGGRALLEFVPQAGDAVLAAIDAVPAAR